MGQPLGMIQRRVPRDVMSRTSMPRFPAGRIGSAAYWINPERLELLLRLTVIAFERSRIEHRVVADGPWFTSARFSLQGTLQHTKYKHKMTGTTYASTCFNGCRIPSARGEPTGWTDGEHCPS